MKWFRQKPPSIEARIRRIERELYRRYPRASLEACSLTVGMFTVQMRYGHVEVGGWTADENARRREELCTTFLASLDQFIALVEQEIQARADAERKKKSDIEIACSKAEKVLGLHDIAADSDLLLRPAERRRQLVEAVRQIGGYIE